jgi:hypothetical protein
MSDFRQQFQQLELDAAMRQLTYVKTHLRNLITDIEEGEMSQEDIVENIKALIGEQQ